MRTKNYGVWYKGQIGHLRVEFPNYVGAGKALIQHREIMYGLKRDSPQYKDELKTHFQLLIFAKAHALALDTKVERRRLLKLLMTEIEHLKIC